MRDDERRSLKDRLIRLTQKNANGCWVWRGAVARKGGYRSYGLLKVRGRYVVARRLAYDLYGLTPDLGTAVVRSTCDNPLCVNPEHLYKGEARKSSGRPSSPLAK